MGFLKSGILLLIFTIIAGFLVIPFNRYNGGPLAAGFWDIVAFCNFGVFILSVAVIVKGLKERSKHLQKKDDEVQELKDKIEKLEKDKEKKD